MANKTKCTSLVRGRVMRVTRMDACGRPVAGDNSVVTSKGFTSIAYTANTDEGTEINVQNAAGDTCVREPAKPKFLGYTVEVTFCNVDPDIFALMTGQRTLVNAAGEVIGFTMDTAVSPADSFFALEAWAGAPTSDACDDGAQGSYGYIVLPFLQGGIVGDFSLENSEVTFTVSNAATRDGNQWGVGPYKVVLDDSDVPSTLNEALTATEHLAMLQTGVAPPAAECGARPFLPIDDTVPTGATAVVTDTSVVFDATVSNSDPFWVDFGDGYWDYSADGTPITYDYGVAGTWSYVIHRGPGSFAGTVVTTL